MADENGTLLARQVRRFIEKFPTSKALVNVEESAKTAILQLGNPGYYADESERVLDIPMELHQKRSFESQYKKLQSEYPSLPNLKGKGQNKEKEREERERKEREERERKEREERERKEREGRERKEREERERKEREGRERKEREERERKEREGREREGREREEREESEESEESEEREREGREERERKEREERERKEREEREKERRNQGNNQSDILDQLRGIAPEQLRGLIQKLGISSRESSVTSEGTSNTSLQGSRETSVNTTSSWNTRGSSVDTTFQASRQWRKVREKLGDDTGHRLSSLSKTCEDKDCDFADVKFYLEYLLRQDSDRTDSELTDLAIKFINDCPNSQARFQKDLSEKDPQLKRSYDRYYAPTQSLGEIKEKRAWARNPQAYRDRLFEGMESEDDEHWDQITLHFDPDTKKKNVKGRITASVAEFLDVCLPSLNGSNEERHYLASKSDYPQETRRFEDSERGRFLTIKPQPRGSLRGRRQSDIKILNYSCAVQPYPDANPRMYFFGIDKRKKKIIKAWARTTYCETKEFKGGLGDLNDQRKACGQKEITTVSRAHRRWPNRDTGSNSDSNSDFDSDIEVA